jgi:hypothetical protein
MTILYIAAHAILRETDPEPKIEKVNITFYMNKIEFTSEVQKSLENGDIDINDLYVVFSKDRNGTLYFVGIEGSDEIKVCDTRKNRDGSITRVLGFK